MSKEFNIQISTRESLQTPTFVPEAYLNRHTLKHADLPGPCSVDLKKLSKVVAEVLPANDGMLVELPNPASCPTIARMDASLIWLAREKGVSNRVVPHVRMTIPDTQQALSIEARRIHFFGNSSEVAQANGNGMNIKRLLEEMGHVADICLDGGVTGSKFSLEHTTQTSAENLTVFARGLNAINERHARAGRNNVITSMGIPDTNGIGDPQLFRTILNAVGPIVKDGGLELFSHLHDDSGMALINLDVMVNFCLQNGIPLTIEAIDDFYPGERTGIRPRFSDLERGIVDIDSVSGTVRGNTWVRSQEDLDDNDRRVSVRHTHVAGVHVAHLENYANGYEAIPQPGLFAIMGKGNLIYIADSFGLDIKKGDKEHMRNASLVAREYAAQYGSQSHQVAVEFVRFLSENPDYIDSLALRFGHPNTWASKPPPDLSELHDILQTRYNEKIRL